MKWIAAAAALLAGVLGPQTTLAQHSPEKVAEWLFSSPRLTRPKLSPSGSHIAALYSDQGNEMIVVRSLDGGSATPIASLPDPEARFRWLRWVSEDRILFSVEELAPSKTPPKSIRTRLYGINRDGSNHVHMARNWGRSILVGRGDFQYEDQILDMLEGDPGQVLIAIRKPTEAYPGVYRLNVKTGGIKPVIGLLEGVSRWHVDHQGEVRAGTGYRHGNWRLFGRTSVQEDFEELGKLGDLEGRSVSFEGFSLDPKKIYVSVLKGDLSALHEFDLSTQELGPELFSSDTFDVPAWLEFSEERKVLTAAGYFGRGRERHFFDELAQKRQEALDRALPRTFNEIVSETHDRSQAIVKSQGDRNPPAYYLYRPAEKKLTFLFSTLPAASGLELAEMKYVSYEARDGRKIPGYLTLPDGASANLPLVVYPHGGPSARDVWGWDAPVQFMAQLGFAVLQPNFRGSTGYGTEHRDAGLQQWGLTMQDDLTDGVQWLAESGVIDASRVCIFGSSYGGYAALMGLVKTPDVFKCAASYAGPSDLAMMLNHDRGYLFSELNVPAIGSTGKDSHRLRQTSPLENVEKFRAPVLLAHGEDDERVHVAHSQKMAKALSKAGKRVDLLVLKNEAHAFRAEEGRIEFFQTLGRFLLENTRSDG